MVAADAMEPGRKTHRSRAGAVSSRGGSGAGISSGGGARRMVPFVVYRSPRGTETEEGGERISSFRPHVGALLQHNQSMERVVDITKCLAQLERARMSQCHRMYHADHPFDRIAEGGETIRKPHNVL